MFYNTAKNKLFIKNTDSCLPDVIFLTAILLICYIGFAFSLEMAAYTLCMVIAILLCLFSPRLELVMYIVPFMYIVPSITENPAQNEQSFLSSTDNMIFLCCLIAIVVVLLIVRIVKNFRERKIAFPKLTYGFLFLGISYICSGLGSGFESFENFVYAIEQIGSLCIFYFIALFAVDWNRASKQGFAWMGFFIGLLLLLEICYIYTNREIIVDGQLLRGSIYTGWGMYNNVGGYLNMTIPCLFYLAAVRKNGWLYLIFAFLFYVGVIFTSSRGSMVAGAVVMAICCVAVIVAATGRVKKIQLSVTVIILIAISCVILCNLAKDEVFTDIINTLISYKDSNRFNLYKQGIEQFKNYPIFGAGFYECDVYIFGTVEISIPPRWHNTFVQLLATGGIVSFAAYIFHRVQTVALVAKKRTRESVFIALCILAMLLGGLLDNHLFNFGPGLLYGIYLAFAEGLPKAEKLKK